MAAPTWEDPEWVFPNTRGKVRRRDSVMRSLHRMLAEAELPADIRFQTSGTPSAPTPSGAAARSTRSPRCLDMQTLP